MVDVMISYRVPETGMTGDSSVFEIASALERAGYKTFVGETSIPAGASWPLAIQAAVTGCRAFVPLCSPSYGDTEWTLRELALADARSVPCFPVWHSGKFPPPAVAVYLITKQRVPGGDANITGDRDKQCIGVGAAAAQLIAALHAAGIPPSAPPSGEDTVPMGIPVDQEPPPSRAPPAGSHGVEVDAIASDFGGLRVAPPAPRAPESEVQGVRDSWDASCWDEEGDELCGTRVRIMWTKGCPRMQANGGRHNSKRDQWWAGEVTAYNAKAGLHRIDYDDGDVELLQMDFTKPGFAEFSTTEVGPDDVGRRLKVQWKANMPRTGVNGKTQRVKRDCWYAGELVALEGKRFAPDTPGNYFVSDAARVRYDDGDVEVLDLSAEDFEWV